MTDPNVLPGILIGLGMFAAIAVAVLALLWSGRWVLRLIERLFLAVVPKRVGTIIVGVVRFYIGAALFCGVTAFALSFLVLGRNWPDSFADPVLRDPLLWLTWLAVMTGIMTIGIVGGLLARYALATIFARLRGPPKKGH